MEPVQGTPTPGRPSGAGAWLAITGAALAALALVVGVVCVGVLVGGTPGAFFTAFTGRVLTTPVDARMQMTAGRYFVYEPTGTRAGGGGVTVIRGHDVTVTPAMVFVVAPDGRRLPNTWIRRTRLGCGTGMGHLGPAASNEGARTGGTAGRRTADPSGAAAGVAGYPVGPGVS